MVSASPPPHYHHITITSTTTFLACKASYTGWGLESRSNPGLLGSRCLRSAGLIRGHLSFHVGTFRAVLGQANAPVFMVTSCSCSCSSQCDRSHRTDLCSELALEPQGPPLVCRVCCQGPAAAGLERPLLEPVCRSPSRAGSGAPGTTACPQSCAARGPAAAGLERPLLEPVCRSPSWAGSGAPGTTACPQSVLPGACGGGAGAAPPGARLQVPFPGWLWSPGDHRLSSELCCQGPAAAGLERPLLEPVCRSPSGPAPSPARSKAQRSAACTLSCASLDPTDYSPPGPSARGILQPRILERAAVSSSGGPSRPRARTQVSCTAGGFSAAEPLGQCTGLQQTVRLRRSLGRNVFFLRGWLLFCSL